MQNRYWQLLVLVPLFSTQLTVQALAEDLPGKPENKTKGIPYAAHPEVSEHHSAGHHVLKSRDNGANPELHHVLKLKKGGSKPESAKTEGGDKTESKAKP